MIETPAKYKLKNQRKFQDLCKLEASIDRFGKKMECNRQDMDRWKARIIAKKAELKQLRKNVAESVSK